MKKFLLALGLSILTIFTWGQNNWDGDNPVGNFSYCDNWYSDTCPSTWNSTTDLNFNYINNSSQTSIYFDLGALKSIKSLIYASSLPKSIDFNGDGNGFDTYGKVENYSSYSQKITIPISSQGTSLELNPINGDLIFTTNIYNNGHDINVYGNNSKHLIISGDISGSGKFIMQQYSIAEFLSSNSYTGNTEINNGELWLYQDNSISSASTIWLGNGGLTSNTTKLFLAASGGGLNLNHDINVNNGNPYKRVIGSLNTGGVNILSGNILNSSNCDVSIDVINTFAHMRISGVINGYNIYKHGLGTLELTGNNNYTGTTTIYEGTLQIGNYGNTGTVNGNIDNQSYLYFSRADTYTYNHNIYGTGNVGFQSGTTILSGSNSYSGMTQLLNGAVVELGATNASSPNSNIFLYTNAVLSSGSGIGYSGSFKKLYVSNNADLILGTGSHELHFENSSGAAWAGTLTIYGWDFLNSGKIYFGSDATGLSSSQLAQINFNGFGTGAYILSDGEVVPALLNCSNTVTWTNGTWSPSAPNAHSNVIIDAGNYFLYNDAEYCSLSVLSGASLTVTKGVTLQVYNDIQNLGTINVQNNASLQQVNETDANDLVGTGTYNIEKTTGSYKNYDYFYWSSPVKNEIIGTIFSTVYYKHQFNPENYLDEYSAHGYPQSTAGSDGYDDNGDDWTLVDNTYIMPQGIGFIAMGVDSPTTFNAAYMNISQPGFDATFTGERVNNGNFTANVYQDAYSSGSDAYNNNLNLLGNPYPSAIDVYELYHENESVLEGKFYFWTHDAPLSAIGGPNTYDFNNNSFAIGTLTGTYPSYTYTQTLSGTGKSAPRYIASAQGFMASAIDGIANPSAITYKNAMRLSGNNNTFLKQTKQENIPSRIWLNLTSADKFNQIAIGFDTSASDAYGMGDAPRIASADDTDFYSVIPGINGAFAIQFLSGFNTDKVVPLGISALQADSYQISIDHSDGVFSSGQNVYLEDTYQNVIHNLSENPYTFYSERGTNINDRFILRFTAKSLDINETPLQNIKLYPNPSNGIFYIHYSGTEPLEAEVFDLLGKRVFKASNPANIDLSNLNSGIYLAKFSTPTGSITRKIVRE